MFIGIDISLNSTAITSYDPDTQKFHFYSFYKNYTDRDANKKSLAFRFINQASDFSVFRMEREVLCLQKDEKENYSLTETTKLKDAHFNSIKIASIFNTQHIEKVAFEGFSYGSSGSSLIDIVGMTYLLRKEMFRLINYDKKKMIIKTPSEVKKFAGRNVKEKTGGANKLKMFELFLTENIKSEFYDVVVLNKKEIVNDKNKILSPVDDIIDSYYVLMSSLEE